MTAPRALLITQREAEFILPCLRHKTKRFYVRKHQFDIKIKHVSVKDRQFVERTARGTYARATCLNLKHKCLCRATCEALRHADTNTQPPPP